MGCGTAPFSSENKIRGSIGSAECSKGEDLVGGEVVDGEAPVLALLPSILHNERTGSLQRPIHRSNRRNNFIFKEISGNFCACALSVPGNTMGTLCTGWSVVTRRDVHGTSDHIDDHILNTNT